MKVFERTLLLLQNLVKNSIDKIGLFGLWFVIVGFMLSGCGNKTKTKEASYLTIKGSDTMVHLASNWAENFMKAHQGIDISVTGGGSGTGIAALLNGTTNVCIASRKIKSKELNLAEEKGIYPKEIVTARDGIAVVVNPENSVNTLSLEQIGKIYTGAYTNWKQVGGLDQQIIVLSRESSSGTFVFFQKRVMNKKDYTQDAMLMPSTAAIIQSVSQDKWAIGYVGLGYATEAKDRVRMLSVRDGDSPTIVPSIAAVQAGEYAIARPLYFYTNGEPIGVVRQFINYVLSNEGQKIVLETGYVPIN